MLSEDIQAILDHFTGPIFVKDEQHRYVLANDAFCEVMDMPREQLLGKTSHDIFPKEYADIFRNYDTRVFETGKGDAGEELVVNLRDENRTFIARRALYTGRTGKRYLVGTITDITAHKRADEALKTAAIQLSAASDLAGVVYWTHDPETKEFTFNDAFYHLHGTTAEREGGYCMHAEEYARRFVPPDDIPTYWRSSEEHRASNQLDFVSDNEHRIVRRDGEVRHVAVKMRVIKDETGRVVQVYGATQDITKQKRAQKEQTRLLDILESSLNEIYIFNPESLLFEYVNQAAMRNLGYSLDALRAMTPLDLKPELDEAVFRTYLVRLLHHEQEKFVFNTTHRRADGSLYPVEVHLQMVERDDQKVFLAMILDTTERRRTEEALRQANLVVESSPVVLFRWRAVEEWPVVMVSHNVIQFGYMAEELLSGEVLFASIIHPDDLDRVSQEVQKYSECGADTFRQEYRIVTRDGSVRWVDDRTVVERDPDGQITFYQGIVMDITEHKEAEEEREKLQAQLNQAQKMESIGRLAGGVAHDFNNMLTVVLGYTELAIDRCNPSDPIYDDLKRIQDSARQSADLVRQLLAFARKQTVAPKVLDLNDTVGGMLKMLQRLIGEEIDFAWMPGAGLWQTRIDPSQIDQLLANLCVNARDAITGVGKITIETGNAVFDEGYCKTHAGFVPGEFVMLGVSDTGCGMDGETIAHIFEPFFTTKETGRGTGLGLATVYGIVKQNGGFINTYSEPGNGSTFKIYLPRFYGEVEESAAAAAFETPRATGETILLVEDDMVILTLAKRILEQLGYTVFTAGTPAEALLLARDRSGEIDLLITDVVMPEMNGRDLAKQLDGMIPGLKCLFTSGYTANVIAHHSILDEGVHFLEKPFSVKSLATKVREALERE